MGKQLGKGYRIAPGVYGDTAEKTGDRSWLCAVYPDPYRYRLPHAAGRLNGHKIYLEYMDCIHIGQQESAVLSFYGNNAIGTKMI